MRLLIIRHADPDYAHDTITPAGHLEAQALATRLQKLGLDHLYVSPLGRAIDTVKYTAEALHLPFTIEPWTAELAHCTATIEPWGKLMAWDIPAELLRQFPITPDNWPNHPVLRDYPLFLETFRNLQRSSDEFLARHGYQRDAGRYRILQPNRKKIAVFCHNGFGLFWLAHLLEIPLPLVWASFHLPPTSVTAILFDERSPQWASPRCLALGDTSHLYATNLPIQPSGIIANRD